MVLTKWRRQSSELCLAKASKVINQNQKKYSLQDQILQISTIKILHWTNLTYQRNKSLRNQRICMDLKLGHLWTARQIAPAELVAASLDAIRCLNLHESKVQMLSVPNLRLVKQPALFFLVKVTNRDKIFKVTRRSQPTRLSRIRLKGLHLG